MVLCGKADYCSTFCRFSYRNNKRLTVGSVRQEMDHRMEMLSQ
jgi:hypothetical protein